jgi:hypothetical protein
MLPVSPKSQLRAKQFLDLINTTKCIAPWVRALFSIDGENLKIGTKYTYPNTSKPPGWFGTWHNAALAVVQSNDWELTTGSLEVLPKDLSRLVADGVSIGKPDPSGQWTNFPLIVGHGRGDEGITVPTQAIKDDLNAQKDAEQHYGSVIVPPGSARGAIVVANRFKTDKGDLPMNADDIVGTLFHEMYHAGQISQDLPNADADPRFNKITKAIETQFNSCLAP